MDAHSKLEIVLNEDEENEDEKRFNEIICYDSGDSDGECNGFEQSETTETNVDIPSENHLNTEDVPNAPDSDNEMAKLLKRSNAAQMRKYRAKQRLNPVRYQQYLERERMRNYKRKYETRIRIAQQKAQELGIPYVVVEAPNARRGRKPKSSGMSIVLPSNFDSFDIEDKSLWVNADDQPMAPPDVESKQSSDGVSSKPNPQISVVNINKLIAHPPRSALQTLLPQEVNERERHSSPIQLEHDYVRQERLSVRDRLDRKRLKNSKLERDRNELLKIQQQCREFILKTVRAGRSGLTQRQQRNESNRRQYQRNESTQRNANSQRNASTQRNGNSQRNGSNQRFESSQQSERNRNGRVQHEDLDDLFKELAEVAKLEPPKKRHSSSSHKRSPGQRSTRKQSLSHEPRITGEFSLTVPVPVKPASKLTSVKVKEEPKWNGEDRDNCEGSSLPDDNHWQSLPKSSRSGSGKSHGNIRNSIEIKQEPVHTDDDFF